MDKKSIEVGFLLVFHIFLLEKAFADELFTCILQRIARNTFLACKLIVHVLLPEDDIKFIGIQWHHQVQRWPKRLVT